MKNPLLIVLTILSFFESCKPGMEPKNNLQEEFAFQLAPVVNLSAKPLCSSAFLLTWEYNGTRHESFEIERKALFGEDQKWHRVGSVPANARRYESVGLPGGGKRAWQHRVRAKAGEKDGPWSDLDSMMLPEPPGGPRGKLIVSSTAEALRNISGSFVKLGNGDLLYIYTASSNFEDYAKSWLPAMALTNNGNWDDRGIMFPSRNDWPIISRPSLVRMTNGQIAITYCISKPKVADANDGSPVNFILRTVFRTSSDD
jgi:hypothetical protein